MKKQVRITAIAVSGCGKDYPPDCASEFLAWFERKLAGIPEEFRDSATIDIEEYDYDRPGIEINYDRPETDEEESARESWELQLTERHKRDAIAKIARLKEEYGI